MITTESTSRTRLERSARSVVIVALLLVPACLEGQVPANLIDEMRPISLGRDAGVTAKLSLLEIRDDRFTPFAVRIVATASRQLGLKRLELTLDSETLEIELPPTPNTAWRGFRPDPNMPEEATLVRTEERGFPLTKADAARLVASETLAVTLVGGREARFEVKPKRLAKLRAWLRERLEASGG